MVASVATQSEPAESGAGLPPPPPPAPTPSSGDAETLGRSAQDRARSHPEPARPLPFTKGLPLLGAIPRVRKKGLLDVLIEDWRRHGDVFRIPLGRPTVAIAHPDAMERVLASHKENYVKGAAYDGVRDILGLGLVTAEGEAWRPRRMLLQPSFHRAGLADMVGCMVQVTAEFLDDLKARYPEGGRLDAHREMTRLTLDVVLSALFGDGLARADEVSYDTLAGTLEVVGTRSNGVPIPLFIPTPSNVRFKRILGELDDIIYRIIGKARAQQNDVERRSTLLGMLLDARDEKTGAPLPDKAVRDEVITFFVAGHETTALTLSWLFTLLEGRDDVWQRLREECDEVLPGGRLPTFLDLPKLAYTRRVVDEALRLRGPIGVIARNVVQDDNVLGYQVKKGDLVMPFVYGLHRHPDFWDDPEHFDPDRFLPENVAKRDRWAYLPFSGGQRVCIGNTFALYEATLILAMLAQRAHFAPVPGQDIKPVMIATLRPSAPIQAEMTWR